MTDSGYAGPVPGNHDGRESALARVPLPIVLFTFPLPAVVAILNAMGVYQRRICVWLILAGAAIGCDDPSGRSAAQTPKSAQPVAAAPAKDTTPAPTRKPLGPGLWLESQGKVRRVVVEATVCLREGGYGLECLLCRRGTKEHESILATEVKAQLIHAALLVAGAKSGSPVRFEPEFRSPSGERIKVSVRYKEKGKSVTIPAQRWIRNAKNKKDLEHDWVFAGSVLFQRADDPEKPRVYAADAEGGYICISNVPSAMLDLPVNSPKSLEERIYEPFTERIPALDTKVELILEPLAAPKEK